MPAPEPRDVSPVLPAACPPCPLRAGGARLVPEHPRGLAALCHAWLRLSAALIWRFGCSRLRSGARSRLSASPSPDIAPGRSACWAAAEPAAIAGWRHASELCGCRSFWGAGRSAERRSWPWFVCLPACTPVGFLVHGASSESCRSSALVAPCAYLLSDCLSGEDRGQGFGWVMSRSWFLQPASPVGILPSSARGMHIWCSRPSGFPCFHLTLPR